MYNSCYGSSCQPRYARARPNCAFVCTCQVDSDQSYGRCGSYCSTVGCMVAVLTHLWGRLEIKVSWLLPPDWSISSHVHQVEIAFLYYCLIIYHCLFCPGATLILIRDKKGHLFGGYAADAWSKRGVFYGSSLSFLFGLLPSTVKYAASGANTNMMWCGQGFTQLPNGFGWGGQVIADATMILNVQIHSFASSLT